LFAAGTILILGGLALTVTFRRDVVFQSAEALKNDSSEGVSNTEPR
jgi:hypothetical protein